MFKHQYPFDVVYAGCNLKGATVWMDYARNGRRIEAIKAFRNITNTTLKEAKDAVDYWIEHPEKFEGVVAMKVWEIPGGGLHTRRRVFQNTDGTYKLETVQTIHFTDLGNLLSYIVP